MMLVAASGVVVAPVETVVAAIAAIATVLWTTIFGFAEGALYKTRLVGLSAPLARAVLLRADPLHHRPQSLRLQNAFGQIPAGNCENPNAV